MAEKKAVKKGAQVSVKRTSAGSRGFTDEEKAAMRERVKELKASAGKEDQEREVLAKIAAMPAADRTLGKRVHEIIKATAPSLAPRLWYGMPAYAKEGKIVCHFQEANKFKTRYATLGFSDEANLDDGPLWPVVFAVKEMNSSVEAKIVALVKKAVG
jgi:uncharacterized protein YdhG (YjbR/CyaY superfamily)